MTFVSDIYRYVLIKHGKVSGDLWLFTLIGDDNTTIALQVFVTWDTHEIDWSEVKILANGNKSLNYSLSLQYLYYINLD